MAIAKRVETPQQVTHLTEYPEGLAPERDLATTFLMKCKSCGTNHDRDINAAITIRNEGLRILGHELPVSLLPDCKTDFVPVQLQLVFE